MIRHYDMASGEPLGDEEMVSQPPMQASSNAAEARLETVETSIGAELAQRATLPAYLAQLDIEAFLRRQR